MRRAIASVLLCWTVAGQGEEWQSKLTPPVLGAGPPMRLMHARYRFGWSKFDAATADFDYAKTTEGLLKLEVKTRTDGFVRKLWSMDATHTALFEPVTLRPVSALQTEIYQKDTLTTKLDFDAGGVSRLRESQPPDKNRPQTKRFNFPGVFDLYGALLFVRSQPLENGDTVRCVVYPATDPYLAEVKVVGREKIEMGGDELRCVEAGPQTAPDYQEAGAGKAREIQAGERVAVGRSGPAVAENSGGRLGGKRVDGDGVGEI